jgi:phage repressor protein C with HTH and peptisase S24 domain
MQMRMCSVKRKCVHVLDDGYAEPYNPMMTPSDILTAISNLTGWDQAEIARRLGVSQPTVSRWVKGTDPRGRHRDALRALLEEVRGRELVSAENPGRTSLPATLRWEAPVVGYIGAGAEVFPVDDYMKGDGLEVVEVDFPVRHGTVAAIVRGDSMMPMFADGDLVGYYGKNEDPSSLIGETCIVKVVDGPTYIKRLKRGSQPGLFTLISANASDIDDVAIEWASPYRFHLPRSAWRTLRR